MSGFILKLQKPIMAHGEQVTQLEIREPTGTEVGDIGFPFLAVVGDDDKSAIELRPKVIQKYISVLCAIPLSSAKAVSLPDLLNAQSIIMGFFQEEPEA